MTNLIIRLFLGLVLASLVMSGILHYLKVPADRYMPPPMMYNNATASAVGVVTKTEDLGYTDHWWAGMDEEYYVDYTFQPTTKVTEPNGKVKSFLGPGFYSGSVRISQDDYHKWNKSLDGGAKPPIIVNYDPNNPSINAVANTQGVFSRSSGLLGLWLLYLLGLLALAVIFEELLKRWIRSE
ncbi:MAG TPA: hypothetical protein VFW40_04165 [Capsulimonadaceae bacterium]|nr:hypothetical protein [Capsulimonadaceae bacterium]